MERGREEAGVRRAGIAPGKKRVKKEKEREKREMGGKGWGGGGGAARGRGRTRQKAVRRLKRRRERGRRGWEGSGRRVSWPSASPVGGEARRGRQSEPRAPGLEPRGEGGRENICRLRQPWRIDGI